MSGLWQRYAGRFDALSLRERVMVFAAVMVAVVALAYTLAIEPQLLKQKRVNGALLQKNSEAAGWMPVGPNASAWRACVPSSRRWRGASPPRSASSPRPRRCAPSSRACSRAVAAWRWSR